MKRVLFAAITAIALGPTNAHAFDIDAMTDAERQAFRAEVRAYLTENPSVIMEAVSALEAAQAGRQAVADADIIAANREAIFGGENAWVGGNPDGDVTLVEFADYQCGYCRRAFDEVASLVAADGDIRFILKEFPILGEASVQAARFAVAVRQIAGDGAYKRVHDRLMTQTGPMTEDRFRSIAEAEGLPIDEIMQAASDDAVTEELQATRNLAQALGLRGTPSFVIGDTLVRGFLPEAELRAIVADTRAD